MKKWSMLIVSSLLVSTSLSAESKLMKNLGSLGANKKIIKRVNELDPKNKIRVVQKRAVDRNNRFEISTGYGMIAGGDPALSSKVLNANVEFHLNPNWSFGLRYSSYDNDPSSHQESLLEQASNNPQLLNTIRSDIDPAKQSSMFTLSWYPLYGKMNMMDMGIAQFDIYTILGLGKIELESGSSNIHTLGAGLGLWINNYINTRLELRYQGYKDQISTGERNIDQTIFSASIGLML